MFPYFCVCAVAFAVSFVSSLSLDPLKMVKSRIPKLNARIEKIVQCDDFPNTPIQFNNMIIDQVGFNQFSLFGDIDLTETFDRPVRLELEMSQCFARGESSTCEYYFTYKKRKICDLLDSGDKTWEYFTKSTNFPKHCPFPAPDTRNLSLEIVSGPIKWQSGVQECNFGYLNRVTFDRW